MGTWGIEPWASDRAADWFDAMFNTTGLALHIEETLQRDVQEHAEEIRAAAFVLGALGRSYVWPADRLIRNLKQAATRLEEILVSGICTNRDIRSAIESQLADIRSLLPPSS